VPSNHPSRPRSAFDSASSASLLATVTDNEPVIRVDNLNHSFGEGEARKQVLFQNNLEIGRGEIIIMTGPSGSGKTTLLTLIGTLRRVQEKETEEADDSSIRVLGQELRGISPQATTELRKQIGFIFQAHNLFESLTALQNAKMATQLVDLNPSEAKTRIEYLLRRLDMGERILYKPKNLSGGQRQRVAVVRGLVHEPKIVLADEPTAALDEKTGRAVVELFKERAKQGCTIIIVTHDNRILDVADRIVHMVDGRIHSNVLVKESQAICEYLKQCDLFADFPPEKLVSISKKMRAIVFPPKTVIFRQGDQGDEFYLIRKGSVDILQKDGKTDRAVATLGDGKFFGEVALLKDQPRNATVATNVETLCYTLSKDAFKEVISRSHSFDEEIRRLAFERQ